MRLLLPLGLLLQLASAVPQSSSKRRTECESNKCLKAVRKPELATIARSFCSTYIGTTLTVPTTTTQSTTVSGPTQTVTIFVTNSVTRTSTIQQPDVVSTTTTTATEVVTEAAAVLARRDRNIPKWLSDCLNPSSVSSACTCLLGSRPTTTVTSQATITNTLTADAITQTVTEGVTVETVLTVTLGPTATVTRTVTQTLTRTTCASNAPTQVVQNVGFEVNNDQPPWTFLDTGFQVGLDLSYCGVAGQGRDCVLSGAGCRCFFTNADSPGGTGSLQQTLRGVCPGQQYVLELFIGRSDNIISGSRLVTTTAVRLDGVELIPPTFVCPVGEPCPIAGGSGPYRKFGPITVVPQSVNPVLSIDFVTNIPANAGIFSVDVFVDDITLTRV